MASATQDRPATLDDLYRFDGKGELIGGRIVPQMATGHFPNLVAGRIFRRLADFVDETGRGVAYTDNMGFTVPEMVSGRESFSPDAAYYDGPLPAKRMRFVVGPPTLAVEVRSKNDYGPAAEREILLKRLDYFAAGTQVVWDVDPETGCVDSYRMDAPDQPMTFRTGQIADAEPAVPGWRVEVRRIFA